MSDPTQHVAHGRTEAVDRRFDDLDRWPLKHVLREILAGQARAIAATEAALPDLERAAEGIATRLAGGGRLSYSGAGTSGRLGVLDAAELLPTFNFGATVPLLAGGMEALVHAAEGAEDDAAAGAHAVAAAGIGDRDALIAIAASGRTPFTLAALRQARSAGAFTVAIANVAASPLLQEADVGIWLDSGPEVLAGSTRLAAGTAQKAALNALSTAVMVRLGGAYRNLMVGMLPTNAKLRARAVAMVCSATGADAATASAALEAAAGAKASGEIRVAIVMVLTGVDAATAAAALERHGRRVRDALGELG